MEGGTASGDQLISALSGPQPPVGLPAPPNLFLTPTSPVPSCSVLLHHLAAPWTACKLAPLFVSHDQEQHADMCLLSLHLHSSTRYLLACQSELCENNQVMDHDIVRFVVYTDGSGGSDSVDIGGPPAWAFVLCSATQDGRYRFEGYLAGLDPTLRDQYATASGPAEFVAALWLVFWFLQAPARFRELPIILFTDSMMVVEAAKGGGTVYIVWSPTYAVGFDPKGT